MNSGREVIREQPEIHYIEQTGNNKVINICEYKWLYTYIIIIDSFC